MPTALLIIGLAMPQRGRIFIVRRTSWKKSSAKGVSQGKNILSDGIAKRNLLLPTLNVIEPVISTHGFIRKRSKVPDNEIQKANQLMIKYFEDSVNGVLQGKSATEVLGQTANGVSQILTQYQQATPTQ